MSSETLHESPDRLRPETIDRHRAVVSLMEELEAIDWYDQRVDATQDDELREILAHNRDEEKEHAAMVLEWLRRRDPVLARQLEEKLFREGPIVQEEEKSELHVIGSGASERSAPADSSLGIGSLKERS